MQKPKTTKIQVPSKDGQYNVKSTVPIGLITDCNLQKGDLFHWSDSQGILSCVATVEETPTTAILQETPGGQFFIEIPRFYKARMSKGRCLLWTWENGTFTGEIEL